jgi:hypothetical protein
MFLAGFVFPGSNLNSVMHNPAGCEIERGTAVPAAALWSMPPRLDSLEPKLRELFHGLEVRAGAFKTAAAQGCGLKDEGGAVADDQDLPVLDGAVLRSMADEAGPAVAQAFIDEFLQLLPVRAATILRGLAGEDPAAAVEGLVSLKVTSAMAGALRLEGYCQKLEHALKHGHRPDQIAVKAVLFANIRLLVREATRQGYLPGLRPDAPEG